MNVECGMLNVELVYGSGLGFIHEELTSTSTLNWQRRRAKAADLSHDAQCAVDIIGGLRAPQNRPMVIQALTGCLAVLRIFSNFAANFQE